MSPSVGACVFIVFAMFFCGVRSELQRDRSVTGLFRRIIEQCTNTGDAYSCLAERAAVATERAINWDIPLFYGVTLARNENPVANETSRASSGFDRLSSAVGRFLNSHTLVMDLDEDTGEEVGEARGKKDKKKKKEKKFASYAMMVMMGVFALTGPLIMKTLALIAGKALIASKMALLIVGSVALKKLFEKEEKAPTVKVRTVEPKEGSDDHERVFYAYNNNYSDNQNYTPYAYYNRVA